MRKCSLSTAAWSGKDFTLTLREGNRILERYSDLAKVTQLGSGRTSRE